MLSPEEKIVKARLQLLMSQPFWGNLIISMPFVEEKDLPMPTMATDGKKIYYHPDFVMEQSIDNLKGVLIHEILHCALGHLTRRKTFHNAQLWNEAVDYSINWQIMRMDGVGLPENVLLDNKYIDWAAEKIYTDLEKVKQVNIAAGEPGNDNDYGKGALDAHLPGSEESQQDMVKKMVEVYDSLSEEEKTKGNIPGQIEEMISNMKKPPIDWKYFFRNEVLDIYSKEDYTYERLSHQYGEILGDVPMPSLSGKKNQTLVVVIDTSASVSTKDLEVASGVIDDICRFADETIVITCDYVVQDVYHVTQFSDVIKEVKFNGRGGTSFVPPFDKLKELKVNPECLIYITDGYGEFPKRPNYPVVWALTPHSIQENQFPWGRTQKMEY